MIPWFIERCLGCSEEELQACRRIERASFSKEQFDLSVELRQEHVRLWVARKSSESTIVGFLLAWLLAGDLEIQTVAVAPEQRRAGAGAALVSATMVEAQEKGYQRLLLEVRASNEPALRLYRGAGFVEDGRRRAYYSDPVEDAVLMSLSMQAKQ